MIEHTELIEDALAPAIEVRRGARERTVYFLRRLRHRARRNAAAQRHAHRLARDRHARGLRLCGDRGRAPPARRRALDRRRTCRARPAAQAGRRLRQQRRDHRRRDYRSRRRAGAVRRVPGRRGRARSLPCAARSRHATWSCSAAAPRKARATCRTASCRGSASPASSCMAWRSSPASRSASRSSATSRSSCCPGFPTSAIFTFHAFVAPVIRARAGLRAGSRANGHGARAGADCLGTRPRGIRARVAGRGRATARSPFRPAKGSGAVTAFSQADGFLGHRRARRRARCRKRAPRSR